MTYTSNITSLYKLSADDERNLLYFSIAVLALNAVFCTELRDNIPEWGRVSPFDCLFSLVHHITKLLVHAQTNDSSLTQVEVTNHGEDRLNSEESSQPSEIDLSGRQQDSPDIVVYPPSIVLPLRALSTIAGACFLFVMTRNEHRWTKTFACLYQLYWLVSCKLLPRPARQINRDPTAKRVALLTAIWGFTIIVYLLLWFLWSSELKTYSTRKYWLYTLLHCLLGPVAGAIASSPPRSAGGAFEAFLYIAHVMYFLPHWLSTLWDPNFPAGRSDHYESPVLIGYDWSLFLFIFAKSETSDDQRWPSALLAICHLLILMILVEFRVFQF